MLLSEHLFLFRMAELLFDLENWELGDLDESNPLTPTWGEGGFDVER